MLRIDHFRAEVGEKMRNSFVMVCATRLNIFVYIMVCRKFIATATVSGCRIKNVRGDRRRKHDEQENWRRSSPARRAAGTWSLSVSLLIVESPIVTYSYCGCVASDGESIVR